MASLDCYFYLDMEEPEDTRIMQTFCIECAEDMQLNGSFFWQGSARGYGEYKIECNKCKKTIHIPEEE